MKRVSVFRAILCGVIGLLIGVVFAALENLVIPGTNLPWTLIPICLASALSALAGYWVGKRQNKAMNSFQAKVTEK